MEASETMNPSNRIGRGLAAVLLALSAVALTTTAASAEPDNGRPFKIFISSEFLNQPGECAPGVPPATLTGTGHATHMGRLTITGETCGLGGVANWIAANGDTISIEFNTVVTGPPNDDGSIPIAFKALDVTGTGRFTNVAFENDTPLVGLAWFYPDGSGGRLEAGSDTRIFYDASDRSRN